MVSRDRITGTGQERKRQSREAVGVKFVCALFCLSLIMGAPYTDHPSGRWMGARDVSAAPGDIQDGEPVGSGNDDTPDQADIDDFASEFDQDGDGEIDEPAEEDDEPADEPDDAEEDDDQDDQDDDDDEYDDDDDGQGDRDDEDDSGDVIHSREDVDRDASPDYRVSGFNRYVPEKKLRKLGDISELTPLIQREEELLFEN